MASKPARISTELQPDSPLVQNADFRADATDRQWVDTRQRAAEQHLADSLLNGVVATWGTLDATSPAVAAGDVVCGAATIDGTLTLATHAQLATSKAAAGVALQAASPGGRVRYATLGVLPPAVTGLQPSTSGFARVSTVGRVERTASFSAGDFALGFVDDYGFLMLGSGAILSSAAFGSYAAQSTTLTAGAGLTGGGDLSADRTFTVGANADGSIVVNANDVQVGVLASDAQHGARGGGTQHSLATPGSPGTPGFLSGPFSALLTGATASATASTLMQRDSNADVQLRKAILWGGITVPADGAFLHAHTAALATMPASDDAWSGQNAGVGSGGVGGGFTFTVGAGNGTTSGSFAINLGNQSRAGAFRLATYHGPYLTVSNSAAYEDAVLYADVADLALSAAGFIRVDNDTLGFNSAQTAPTITQAKKAGTSGADAPDLVLEGGAGEDALSAQRAGDGGNVRVRGGAGGGGAGYAGARASVVLGVGSATAGGGSNVVVVNDAVLAPTSASGGFVLYSASGLFKVKQQTTVSFTQTYGTQATTLPAYASNAETVDYTGIASGVGGTPYAHVDGLNALRVSVENLRPLAEDTASVLNKLITVLKGAGLIS